MNSRKWWGIPSAPLLWLVYEFRSNPQPTLRWLFFRGLIPVGGGVAIFLITNLFVALTTSADREAPAPPIARAVDPFGWLFGSVTLGCAALGDGWSALFSYDDLRQTAVLCVLLTLFALVLYSLAIRRRALLQPGQFKPRTALVATALGVAVAMVGEAHHVSAILYTHEHAGQTRHHSD